MKLNLDVEIARLFGFACVVIAHANSLDVFRNYQTTGFVLDEMCRSVIQVFFLVSGFFWRPQQIDEPFPYLCRLFPKIAIPFVLWAAIYLTLDATQILYSSNEIRTWRSYVTTPWSGGIAFHLWFLPALFVGTAVGLYLIKWLGLDRAMLATLVLFLIGVILGTYLRPFGIDVPLSLYRNGIFFAPVFLVGGYYFRTRETLPSFLTFTLIAAFGAGLNLVEGIYVFGTTTHAHDLSLATLPFGIGVFGMFLHLKSKAVNLASWGRDVFGAYLIHVLIMKILIEWLAPAMSPILIALTIAITFAISLAFSRLAKKNRWTQYFAP